MRLVGSRSFNLSGFLFHKRNDMVDKFVVGDFMVGHAGEVDHMVPLPAARKANVGFPRFTRSVHNAANNRQAERRMDMRETFLKHFNGLITGKACRAQDGQETMRTPRWRSPSDLSIS